MRKLILALLLIVVVCSATENKLQLSVYGEAYNKPFEQTAYADCRLTYYRWAKIASPYLALTKYTTFGEVNPIYGIGLVRNWQINRLFIDLSTQVYNDNTFRFNAYFIVDIIK